MGPSPVRLCVDLGSRAEIRRGDMNFNPEVWLDQPSTPADSNTDQHDTKNRAALAGGP